MSLEEQPPGNNGFHPEGFSPASPLDLQAALTRISQETGEPFTDPATATPETTRTFIDFNRIVKKMIEGKPGDVIYKAHPEAINPDTNELEEDQKVRSRIDPEDPDDKRFADLIMFLGDFADERHLGVITDRIAHPHKNEDKMHDFVIVTEPMAEGGHWIAVFEYPLPSDYASVYINHQIVPFLKLRLLAVQNNGQSKVIIEKSRDEKPYIGLLANTKASGNIDGSIGSDHIVLKDARKPNFNIALPIFLSEKIFPISNAWNGFELLGKSKIMNELEYIARLFISPGDIRRFLSAPHGPDLSILEKIPNLAQILEDLSSKSLVSLLTSAKNLIPGINRLNPF